MDSPSLNFEPQIPETSDPALDDFSRIRAKIDSLVELPKDPMLAYRIIRFDPWAFMRFAVYTKDQVDLLAPVKPAPCNRAYLKTLVRLWEQEPLLALVKSRRMWCSWLFLGLYLWDTCMHRYRDNYIASKKESDADELVKRCSFIYDNIPFSVWHPDLRPPYAAKENHMTFPGIGSGLHAVAQGADQLRQVTASGILMDEFAFWERDKDTYTASKPTIEGGGRVTIVSTPPPRYGTDPSFYQRLCQDTIDMQGEA